MTHLASVLHVDDVGTRFAIDLGRALVAGDAVTLRLKKPDGTIVEKAMTFTAGQTFAFYTTIASDFAVAGQWSGEVKFVAVGAVKTLYTDGFSLRVLDHFEEL